MERRLELIFEMGPAIWIHLIAALIALLLGAYVLWRRKGDRLHRYLGRIWVATMVVVAVSSFWIKEIFEDSFSPIHLLSVWALISMALGIRAIRNRHVNPQGLSTHRAHMQSLYVSSMLIAGGFTLLPDRLLGRLTFGEWMPQINYVIVATLAIYGFVLLRRSSAK